MSDAITRRVQFNGGARGRRRLEEATPKPEIPADRVPQISRLRALATQMQRLIDEGQFRDYAELARPEHVSQVRVTQVTNLNFLAPEIQEEILFLPRVERGRDPIREHAGRAIAAVPDWGQNRRITQTASDKRGDNRTRRRSLRQSSLVRHKSCDVSGNIRLTSSASGQADQPHHSTSG